MLFLKSNDALTLLEEHVVPLADPTVCFHLADRVVVLIAESNLIDPVLACFDANFADLAVCWENHARLASVNP